MGGGGGVKSISLGPGVRAIAFGGYVIDGFSRWLCLTRLMRRGGSKSRGPGDLGWGCVGWVTAGEVEGGHKYIVGAGARAIASGGYVIGRSWGLERWLCLSRVMLVGGSWRRCLGFGLSDGRRWKGI